MLKETCIQAGKRVLQEEAAAILDLIPTIDENFAHACDLLLNCQGKVILTGVGKSGHIATKIASTLASTGTQAFFVQACEAAHGDLGMIGEKDVVIAISNSGETGELLSGYHKAERFAAALADERYEVACGIAQRREVSKRAHIPPAYQHQHTSCQQRSAYQTRRR